MPAPVRLALCLALAAPAGGSLAQDRPLPGEYRVVDLRRASAVAAPPAELPAEAIGTTVLVGPDGARIEGLGCDAWQAAPAGDPGTLTSDPVLADTQVGPNEGAVTRGDARLNALFRVSCEGEYVTTFLQVDDRTAVATLANETVYLILERPLDPAGTARLEAAMRMVKFLTADPGAPGPDGLPEGLTQALRGWLGYRLDDSTLPVPARPAITRNLLDGLNVWDD